MRTSPSASTIPYSSATLTHSGAWHGLAPGDVAQAPERELRCFKFGVPVRHIVLRWVRPRAVSTGPATPFAPCRRRDRQLEPCPLELLPDCFKPLLHYRSTLRHRVPVRMASVVGRGVLLRFAYARLMPAKRGRSVKIRGRRAGASRLSPDANWLSRTPPPGCRNSRLPRESDTTRASGSQWAVRPIRRSRSADKPAAPKAGLGQSTCT
jgi:hypothetical protein